MNHLKTLFPLARKHSLELIVGFCFMILQNYGFMKAPMYMRQVLDEITGPNRIDLIAPALWMILAYTALTVASMFLMRKLIISASRKIEYELRGKIYHKLLGVSMKFFQEHETGDLTSRCTNDLNDVRMLLGPGVMYIPNSLSRLALFFPVLIQLSAPLMIMVLLMLAFIISLILAIMPRLRPLFLKVQENVGAINSRVWQVVSGMTTVKLYSLEPIEIERFKALNQEYVNRQMAIVKARGFLWPLFIFIFSLTELLILIGGRQVILGEMTIGELLQFTVMVAHLTFPVLSLGWVMTLIQQGITAMGRINHILDYPVERRSDWKRLENDALEFTAKNLTYTYQGNSMAVPTIHPPRAHKPGEALHDMSLTIRPGQTVAITGTIGSGKTTFINLISGLFQPERGMLFINGVDIRDIHPSSLCEKISVVPQETFLFSRSIAQNIALGLDGLVDMNAIQEATRNAGLADDIETFPDKYEQMLGERGITLSGGQKQRAAIARALLKRSPVLIFDDALSSVDAKTEAHILDNLKTARSFSTLIIISHRISALKNADIIYVFDGGNLVEQGTHAALLDRNGLYARLAKMQQMQMQMEEDNS